MRRWYLADADAVPTEWELAELSARATAAVLVKSTRGVPYHGLLGDNDGLETLRAVEVEARPELVADVIDALGRTPRGRHDLAQSAWARHPLVRRKWESPAKAPAAPPPVDERPRRDWSWMPPPAPARDDRTVPELEAEVARLQDSVADRVARMLCCQEPDPCSICAFEVRHAKAEYSAIKALEALIATRKAGGGT